MGARLLGVEVKTSKYFRVEIPDQLLIFLTYLFSSPIEFLARFKIPRVVTLVVLIIAFCFVGYLGVQVLMSNVEGVLVAVQHNMHIEVL